MSMVRGGKHLKTKLLFTHLPGSGSFISSTMSQAEVVSNVRFLERAAYLLRQQILERDAKKVGQVLSKEISKVWNLQSVRRLFTYCWNHPLCSWKEGLRLEWRLWRWLPLTLVAEKIAFVTWLVLAISPFNYPVKAWLVHEIAPALIYGDVVAFKAPTSRFISRIFLLVGAFVWAGILGVLNKVVVLLSSSSHRWTPTVDLNQLHRSTLSVVTVVWQLCVNHAWTVRYLYGCEDADLNPDCFKTLLLVPLTIQVDVVQHQTCRSNG